MLLVNTLSLGFELRLHFVCSGSLAKDVASRGIDLYRTLSIYNFDFWFDGSRAFVVLDLEDPCIAMVKVTGEYSIYCASEKSCNELVRTLEFHLGIHEDTSEFLARARLDPLLSSFAREFSGWRLRSCSLWWALVVGICQQNASFRQGWSMLRGIIVHYGKRASINGLTIFLPPNPEDVLKDPSKLTSARVGYRAKIIESVARAFVNGDIREEEVSRLRPSEAEEVLRVVKGVGSYTARLALALGLRIYDLPPIDRWVKAIASRVYGIDEKVVESEWTKRWGKWSALAVIALTIALDAQPLRRALERIERGELLPKGDVVPSPSTLWMWRPSQTR